MRLAVEPYLEQKVRWPQNGKVILANYDAESVTVYQAYRPAIGNFAVKHGYFGGEHFKLSRMTWIKPNFLWMMYRSGWGTKQGQEVTLAIRLHREAFDQILAQAVHSTFLPERYTTRENWQQAVQNSDVRLQWDPDHSPSGGKLERRAIQLGLRGEVVPKYAKDWIISIEDISEFVEAQRSHVVSHNYELLMTPSERPYKVKNPAVAQHLQLSGFEE